MKKTLFLIPFLAALFISCGPRSIGYGVLLWSPDEEMMPTGTFVNIYQESHINDTYSVGRPGKGEETQFELWRVETFSREADARKFAAEYAEFTGTYAISTKQGLPLREEENPSSERVYKLRDGQNIKVIGRSSQKVSLGSLNGFWYKVLTEDGVSGYCFDYYLNIYNMNEAEKVFVENEEEENPRLTNLFAHVWRPKMFLNMITRNTIDLEVFNTRYGIQFDEEEKTIRLTLPEHTVVETWSKISKIGYNRYFFEGTSFQITLTSDDFISVEYSADGRQFAVGCVLLAQPMTAYISAERNRRYQLYQEIFRRGTVLSSDLYGKILLDAEQNFSWKPLTALINAGVLPASSSGEGSISFARFLTPQMKQGHDGAATFLFQDEKNPRSLTFLYSLTESGIQLIFIPDNLIKDNTITEEPFYEPLVMFFTFSES